MENMSIYVYLYLLLSFTKLLLSDRSSNNNMKILRIIKKIILRTL